MPAAAKTSSRRHSSSSIGGSAGGGNGDGAGVEGCKVEDGQGDRISKLQARASSVPNMYADNVCVNKQSLSLSTVFTTPVRIGRARQGGERPQGGGDIRRIGGEMEWAKEEVHAKVSRNKDSADSHDKGSHVPELGNPLEGYGSVLQLQPANSNHYL